MSYIGDKPTVKRVEYDPQASDPANPTEGQLFYSDGTSRAQGFWEYDGTQWNPLGTSAGGINYIANPDAEGGTTGYAAYADAAQADPVDGSGGSPTVTITTTSTDPLRGVNSFLLTKDAADRQGEGFSTDFTIDNADLAQPLSISFDYEASANFDFGDGTVADISDVSVWIYDVTNAVLIQPAPIALDGSGKFQAQFQTNYDSNDYRLIFHIPTTNASAWTFKCDNIFVGPQELVSGSMIGTWQTYTPTVTNGPALSSNTGLWRRVGDSMQIMIQSTSSATGVSGSDVTWSLPSGYTIEGNKTTGGTTSFQNMIGSGHTNGTFDVGGVGTSGNSALFLRDFDSGTFVGTDWINGNTVRFFAQVPITGWGNNVELSNGADTRVVAVQKATLSTNFIHNSNGNFLTLPLDTVENDTHGAFDTANNRYVVPVSGFYNIRMQATFTALVTAGTQAQGRILIDGVEQARDIVRVSGSGNAIVKPELTAYKLNAGQLITFEVSQDESSSENVSPTAALTFASIVRAPGPGTVAMGEKVFAKARTTTAQSVANDDIVDYSTVEYDSHGAITTGASWTFTAPRSGVYNVNASTKTASVAAGAINQVYGIQLEVDGTAVDKGSADRAETTSSRSYGSILSTSVRLNAGQTLAISFSENIPAVALNTVASDNYVVITSD